MYNMFRKIDFDFACFDVNEAQFGINFYASKRQTLVNSTTKPKKS